MTDNQKLVIYAPGKEKVGANFVAAIDCVDADENCRQQMMKKVMVN